MNKLEKQKDYKFFENWIIENWDELEFRRKLKQARKIYFTYTKLGC